LGWSSSLLWSDDDGRARWRPDEGNARKHQVAIHTDSYIHSEREMRGTRRKEEEDRGEREEKELS
jgi:hypothetical protein